MRNLIIYLRFLSKHKTLSSINVLGLSIGIATCIFIGLYISHELSYDHYHQNLDRIFAITTKFSTDKSLDHISTTSYELSRELLNYPEVQQVVRLSPLHNATVSYTNKYFKEKDILEADPQIFKTFSYPLLKGNPATALTGTQNIVISESMAIKYFGQEDPINKTLKVNGKEYQVTGVLKDIPSNSDLQFSALVSMNQDRPKAMWDFDCYMYVLLGEDYLEKDRDGQLFAEKIAKLSDQRFNELLKKQNEPLRIRLPVQRLADVHFRQGLYDDTPKGNITYIYILASVGLLMLFIGSLNFINFSLVQSLERAKEVGIRKVIGARFFQLVWRYLSESIMITILAFLVAIVFVILFIPVFNDLTGKHFLINDLLSIRSIGFALFSVLVLGILAGSYPAFFTSSIKPLQSLKGRMSSLNGMGFRKISIIAQFSIAIGLIICTLLTYKQMEYIANYNLGFRKDNVVVIDSPVDSIYSGKLILLKESLSRNKDIQRVSKLGYGSLPGDVPMKGTLRIKQGGESKIVNILNVDENYLPTLDIILSQGRNFDLSQISDKHNAAIINESFAKLWGWDNPLTEKVQSEKKDMNVIGVIKDFHFSSLHSPVEPFVVFYNESVTDNILVRFNNDYPISKQVSLLKNEWEILFPDQPFVYSFLDESIASQYVKEEKAISLFTIFSTLTIIVSCLGLFGLCSLTISQRKREVGIRKIVGASFTSIVSLFSKEYLLLISVSFLLISPVAVWVMNRWLESFPVNENISVSVFIMTGIGVIILAVLTIILGIAKTSNANPVELIRE